MDEYNLPQISGQIEYLEKNLSLIKQAFSNFSKKEKSPKKTLFGSLPKVNLSFMDFKKLRKELSSSWEAKWST